MSSARFERLHNLTVEKAWCTLFIGDNPGTEFRNHRPGVPLCGALCVLHHVCFSGCELGGQIGWFRRLDYHPWCLGFNSPWLHPERYTEIMADCGHRRTSAFRLLISCVSPARFERAAYGLAYHYSFRCHRIAALGSGPSLHHFRCCAYGLYGTRKKSFAK